MNRILAAEAHIDSLGLAIGRMDEDELGRAATSVQNLYNVPLFMDDRLHKSVADIWTACEELAKEGQLGVVIVDAMPFVSDLGQTDVWNSAKLLKLMARHFNVPVVAATHLYSGRADRRADKRPMMGDLAGVESYADEVILLHRTQSSTPGMGLNDAEAFEFLDIIVAKQANGPTGCIRVGFVPQYALLTDLDVVARDEPTGF